ncbi:hypothetical protein [Candidatus Nanohalobium constans]|uniref:Uncharacterized protein n=1 Tax=Candidatus Nanohalobium constans TaxID=2565781 RepID=A0A5Q0UIQ3_9ARCH|nr:hypothetical protein [Candidatus Nanohalobium constans]QGA81010.1 hypothetical protein LC1Nh_1143 [Candidatus Nanohalobium constans]
MLLDSDEVSGLDTTDEAVEYVVEFFESRLEPEYLEKVAQGDHDESDVFDTETPNMQDVDLSEYSVRAVGDYDNPGVIISGPGRNCYLGGSPHDKNAMATSNTYNEDDEIVENMLFQLKDQVEKELVLTN